MKKIEFAYDEYEMLAKRDFSIEIALSTKYPLILDFYTQTADPDAGAYIKKNCSKLLNYITDSKTASKLLENKLISAATFNKFLINALENKKTLFDFFVTNGQDTNAIVLLSKNCKLLMHHIIDTQNMDALGQLLNLGCVTKKNIDEFIEYAADKKSKAEATLKQYKAEHI